jgi:hypothetical protein
VCISLSLPSNVTLKTYKEDVYAVSAATAYIQSCGKAELFPGCYKHLDFLHHPGLCFDSVLLVEEVPTW